MALRPGLTETSYRKILIITVSGKMDIAMEACGGSQDWKFYMISFASRSARERVADVSLYDTLFIVY